MQIYFDGIYFIKSKRVEGGKEGMYIHYILKIDHINEKEKRNNKE
jgi:hypothetical protein